MAEPRRVLVTRPAGQADRLCRMLDAAGYEAIPLPAMEISTPLDRSRFEMVMDELDSYDMAVFVSVNAVNMGLELILNQRDWPEHTLIATVGARSAEALLKYGLSADFVPEHRFNSEALLALDDLQDMSGQRVAVFRGNGGREHLHDTLIERGAEVDYAEVYRRVCPLVDAKSMLKLLRPGFLYCITVNSNETLQNLFEMAGPEGRPLLLDQTLVVAAQRQQLLAQQLGFTQLPVVALNASDAAMLTAIRDM
jgi:uroporphyrinogen-III synthase